MIFNIGRVGRFEIAGSISSVKLNSFRNASVYGSLFHMQNTIVPDAVDEEQDIRNDGSKSSRSHRAYKFSNQLFLASTNARHFPRFDAQTHDVSVRVGAVRSVLWYVSCVLSWQIREVLVSTRIVCSCLSTVDECALYRTLKIKRAVYVISATRAEK
jgi:hypothetical protein